MGWSLGGFRLMLQSSAFDSVALDPFAFQQDSLASAEVDVARGRPRFCKVRRTGKCRFEGLLGDNFPIYFELKIFLRSLWSG